MGWHVKKKVYANGHKSEKKIFIRSTIKERNCADEVYKVTKRAKQEHEVHDHTQKREGVFFFLCAAYERNIAAVFQGWSIRVS
jgi:hypothetical protein